MSADTIRGYFADGTYLVADYDHGGNWIDRRFGQSFGFLAPPGADNRWIPSDEECGANVRNSFWAGVVKIERVKAGES